MLIVPFVSEIHWLPVGNVSAMSEVVFVPFVHGVYSSGSILRLEFVHCEK